MRKIFAFIMTTLDGYYEGPNQEFDFWVVDEEFNRFAVDQLDEVDTLVFGRVTYQGMAASPTSSPRPRCRQVRVPAMSSSITSPLLDRWPPN